MQITKRLSSSMLSFACMVLLCAAVLWLAACSAGTANPTAQLAPTQTTVPVQPPPASTDTSNATPPPTSITLTMWTTEIFSPTQAFTHGQILAQQVVDFEDTHRDVKLDFVRKKPYGKGGMLDYLLTTQSVVPSLLPDLAFVDIDELDSVVQAGLAQPLDDLIPVSLRSDLYPAARDACTFDGRLYGLQFLADLEHLAYDTGKMTVAPRSWPGVLSNPGPYIFPAGGEAGLINDAFLIQYLAIASQPIGGEPGELPLDQESVAGVLQYYQDGLSRGIFPAEILSYHITDDTWQVYRSGQAALTHVTAHRYLTERNGVQSTVAAPIPSISGPTAAINHGWALVLLATESSRQSVAVDLMLRMMAPQTNASWNLSAGFLPTRQAALAEWNQEDGYVSFIEQQLLAVRPRPSLPNYTKVAAALQEAVENVLTMASTPEEAAAQVMEDIK